MICKRAIPAGKHHTRHAKFNRKGTPRWVPVSNATLDKDTLTKAPGTARMTISKTTSTFAGMALGPLEGSQKVRYVCDAEKMAKINHRAIPGGKHHTRHAKFNQKGTPGGYL